MVPEDWQVKELSELTDKIGDGIHSTPKYAERSTIHFINGNNLKNGGILINGSTKYVDESDAISHQRDLSERTLLMSINGTIGNLAYYRGERVVLGKSACYLNISPKVDLNFIYFVLSGNRVQNFYTSELTGTTIRNLSLKTIKATKIPIPPLPEQKKIAQTLSTWDQAITATERLLENSQQRKKGLMQQLLSGKKRLPGFEEEWAQVSLGSIFSRVTTRNEGQSTNVVTISGQQGLIRQQEFFKKSVASETLDGYYLLKKGQFAYNKSYSNGYPMGAIKRLNRYRDGVVTTLYICFELSDSNVADSDFYEQYFESGLMINGLMQIAHEGGRAHGLLNVKPSDFFSLKLFLPPLGEQKAISLLLCKADEEVEAQKRRLNQLQQEKKSLMQQLLTGKRRVQVEAG